jgi:hypothetical protein
LPAGVRALSAATIDGIPARVTLDEQFGSRYAVVMAVATAVIVVRWA